MGTLKYMYTVWVSILLNEVLSQTVTTVTYTGTLTTIRCPAQGSYTLPSWIGPPYSTTTGTPYTLTGSAQFNPALPADKLARLMYAANKRDLLLNNTRMDDAGVYKCFITGQFDENNELRVRVLSAEPEITTSITVDNNGVRATEGQSLTVTCTSRGGNPAPTVVWYKGSITVPELARTSTGTPAGDGTYTVTLPHTFTPSRQDDSQQLVCRSYYPTPADSQGSQQKAVTLYLYLKPSQPTFHQPVSVVTGGTATANCTTTGSRPAAGISWTYLGQTLTSSVNTIEDQSSQTFTVVSVLQRLVTAADNGQTVQCRVTNRALTNSLTESKALDVQFPVEQSTSSITGNRVTEANGNNPLTLTCTTGSSNPASSITWRNGSDAISNPNAYTDTTGANNGIVRSQVLTLQPTRYEDGYTISCSVSNGILHVTDTTSTVLNLNYSPLIAGISDMKVTEGDSVTLKCNASSKPVSSFTWGKGSGTLAQGTGTASYNGYDYTISTVNRNQTGTYTCTADNQLSRTDSKHTTIMVLYPPDIAVDGVNTTVNSQSTVVTCEASGVPDQYVYESWVHTWGNQIVTHPTPLPGTKVLTLTDLSYAHSGVYTCGASNGVKGVAHGSGNLLVKSFPVLIGEVAKTKEIKIAGQLKQPIKALLHYYSNAGKGSVKVYRNSGTRQEVGDVSYRDVSIRLSVFLSEITTLGTEAIISITVEEESHFGTYEVRVTNEIDTVILTLMIQSLGPPEPPFDMIIVLVHQSIDVTWKSGFPNGLNQTFIIQLSTDNSTWRNTSQYGGISFQHINQKRIDGLDGGQLYYIRMVSKNDVGEARPTRIISFKTEAQREMNAAETSAGVLVGGAISGTLVAVVVVEAILLIIWWRKGAPLPGKRGISGTSGQLNQVPRRDGRHEKDETVAAGNVTAASSDTTQHYEALKAADDKRLYTVLQSHQNEKVTNSLDPDETPHYAASHQDPNCSQSYGLSIYENFQGNKRSEPGTYDEVQRQGNQRTVYENLKVAESRMAN